MLIITRKGQLNMAKATSEEIERRLRIVKDFLTYFEDKEYSYVFDEEFEEKFRPFKEVRKTGLTLKELYYCLCGKPNLLKISEPLKEGSIRDYVKRKLFRIENGYIIKTVPDNSREFYDRIRYALERNKCIAWHVIINRIADPFNIEPNMRSEDEGYDDDINYDDIDEYTFVLLFKSNIRISSIAEDLSKLKGVKGVTWGYKIIRIYCIGRNNFIAIRDKYYKIENRNY